MFGVSLRGCRLHRGRFADYAILYRGNHQARVFETALRARDVPYEVSGGQSMFDRPEIKDIVAYLRLIANDGDDPAFVRAVTTPKRGIGPTTLSRLSETATQAGASLFAAVFEPRFRARVPARQRETLEAFCAIIDRIRHRAEREPAGRHTWKRRRNMIWQRCWKRRIGTRQRNRSTRAPSRPAKSFSGRAIRTLR